MNVLLKKFVSKGVTSEAAIVNCTGAARLCLFDVIDKIRNLERCISFLLRPIYMVRLWRMRQVYDRPTIWIFSCKSNLQLSYDCCVSQKNCRGILKHVLKRCDNRSRNPQKIRIVWVGDEGEVFFRQNGGRSCCWLVHMKSFLVKYGTD